jgi:voltage-gated potassium channel
MALIREIGIALRTVIVTLWLQSAGLAALIHWVRRTLATDTHRLGPVRSAVLVVQLTAAVVVLHGVLILFWASCYRRLCFSSWESALYFSASSYATVGYDDVVLPSNWRMLGPLERIIRVLMCGISVSVLFATITRLVNREGRTLFQRGSLKKVRRKEGETWVLR